MKVHSDEHVPHFSDSDLVSASSTNQGKRVKAASQPKSDSGIVRSAEVASLSRQVGQIRVVRSEVITHAAQQLAAGSHLTSQAAVATADAILNRVEQNT
jgi:hypothetical protein